MWRIPLAFILFIAILFIVHRINDHFTVAQEGGIRKKYNRLFSFIYSLPGSKLTVETKSFCKFVPQHKNLHYETIFSCIYLPVALCFR